MTQQWYKCPNCSSPVIYGYKFCGTCGVQLSQTARQQATEPQGPLLLLLRPSLPKIFEDSSDSSPVDADVIQVNSGLYNAKGMIRHMLERFPILCISETGNIGYTIPMRLDLMLCLEKLASSANPPIDFPLGLFTNRDVMMITEGLYNVLLLRNPREETMKILGRGGIVTHTIPASRIVYYCTTVDEGVMTNHRRLEATAEHLLSLRDPTTNAFAKLSPDIVIEWQHDFLEPIFNRARAGRQ